MEPISCSIPIGPISYATQPESASQYRRQSSADATVQFPPPQLIWPGSSEWYSYEVAGMGTAAVNRWDALHSRGNEPHLNRYDAPSSGLSKHVQPSAGIESGWPLCWQFESGKVIASKVEALHHVFW